MPDYIYVKNCTKYEKNIILKFIVKDIPKFYLKYILLFTFFQKKNNKISILSIQLGNFLYINLFFRIFSWIFSRCAFLCAFFICEFFYVRICGCDFLIVRNFIHTDNVVNFGKIYSGKLKINFPVKFRILQNL